jgi:hypothetical protein
MPCLSWHLDYYKKKHIDGQLLKKAALLIFQLLKQ